MQALSYLRPFPLHQFRLSQIQQQPPSFRCSNLLLCASWAKPPQARTCAHLNRAQLQKRKQIAQPARHCRAGFPCICFQMPIVDFPPRSQIALHASAIPPQYSGCARQSAIACSTVAAFTLFLWQPWKRICWKELRKRAGWDAGGSGASGN